jgi:hypothetical protein
MTEDSRATGAAQSRKDLETWLAGRGLVLVSSVVYEQLCADAAFGYAVQVDLDADFDVLFGTAS